MRKILLLLSFLTLFSTAYAQDPVVSITTVKANQGTKTNQYTEAATLVNAANPNQVWNTFAFSSNSGSWDNIRCGRKNNASTGTITTNFAISASINKITIKLARFQSGTNDKITSISLLVGDDADMTNATTAATITDFTDFMALSKTSSTATPTSTCTYDFEIANPQANKFYQLSFDMPSATNNGVVGVLQIDYYGQAEAGAVEMPTITLGENNMVTLTQADGADIYYTTNGDVPTTSSTKYSAPFAINGITTVKAIAALNGKESDVNSKLLTPNTVGNIADFISIANTTADTKINAPLTAIYQCGRNLYLTDGTDFILAYNNNNLADFTALNAVNGDEISFINGVFKSQNGLPEIIPSAVGEKTKGSAIDPEELAIEEIASDMLNKFVMLTDVNITELSSANNYNGNDGTGDIVIYNTFASATYYPEAIEQPDGTYGNTIPTGEGFTVVGFVSCFGTTIQITPISITGGKVLEKVEAPVFTPETGSKLAVGDKITIETATEGATIYFTTDDIELTAENGTEYTGELTFSEAVTIKAIAVKEGMLDSDPVTATYELAIEGAHDAMFDFTENGNAADLTDATIVAGNGQTEDSQNLLTNTTYLNGPVLLTLGSTNTSVTSQPRWWETSSIKKELRIYAKTTIKFEAVRDGYKLSSIKFEQGDAAATNYAKVNVTAKTNVEGATGTWDTNTKTWTAPENETINSVEFTQDATARLGGFSVIYVEDNDAMAGIEDINIDNSNAPVEYYNLQGIRVNGDNLTPGIYIRRQGTEVSKILVK